jgi:hypothetical protein
MHDDGAMSGGAGDVGREPYQHVLRDEAALADGEGEGGIIQAALREAER